MGVMLYREGDKHEIRGIKCEFVVVALRSMPGHLAQGWKKRVEDLYQAEEPQPAQETAPATPEPDPPAKPKAKAGSHQAIRNEARDAGIVGWDTKRIGTLKSELGYG